MQKIVSNEEIKTILGITGSGQDALLNIWNETATEILARDILKITDFAVHTVTDELVPTSPTEYLSLTEFPIDPATITLKNVLLQAVTGYTFQSVNNSLRRVRILGSSGTPTFLPQEELLATYSAGYRLKDTMRIISNANLTSKTISVTNLATNTTTVYTLVTGTPGANEIQIGGSASATAANIAAKITGSTSSGDTATIALGYQISGTTIAGGDGTVSNANIPQALKMAVALMAGGGMVEKDKRGGIASYRIGSKQVDFRDDTEKRIFENVINNLIGSYKKTNVYA